MKKYPLMALLVVVVATSLIYVTQYVSSSLPFLNIYILPDFLNKVGYVKHNIPYVETKIPNNEIITNEILSEEIRRILGNYDCSLSSYVEVFNNGKKEHFTFYDKNKKVGTGKVLYIQVSGGTGVDLKKYADIKAMMDIWLFLTEYQLSENIDGIAYWFNKVGKLSADTEIHISKVQFLEFYNLANVNDLQRKEKIEVLTNLWIDKVNYIRPPGQVDVTNMLAK